MSERDGVPLPDKIANKPELLPGLELYYRAFQDLSTCRSIGFGVGPIPWTAVEQFADAMEYDDDHRYCLHYHVTSLDSVYVKHANKSADGDK